MVEIVLESRVGTLHVGAPSGYVLLDAAWSNDAVVAQVRVEKDADRCETCGSSDVRKYGRSDVGILDAPNAGLRSRLIVARQRVECLRCTRLSREALPGVAPGHRYTIRCADWIRSQLTIRPKVAIAAVLGMDETSVRAAAKSENVVTRAKRALARSALECASCLRLIPAPSSGAAHIHHALPSDEKATNVTAATSIANRILLCEQCHSDAAVRWVWKD